MLGAIRVPPPSLSRFHLMPLCLCIFQETGVKVSPRQKPGQPRCSGEVQRNQQRPLHLGRPHKEEHLRQIRLSGTLRGGTVRRGECQHLLCLVKLVGKGTTNVFTETSKYS